MSKPQNYIPGVCNIGASEIRARRASGWGGLTATLILALVLFAFNVAPAWRLLVFFPATFAASGFLQAAQGFCLGFGFKAAFNFGERGSLETVENEEYRLLDRRKARSLLLGSMGLGLAAAALAFWI